MTTTAAGNRVRRSARFAVLPENGDTSVQGVSSRRARMTERLREDRFPNTQDWAFRVGTSPSGRFQVVEEPRKRTKMFSEQGIRWDAAKFILIGVGCVMAVVLLVMLASIGSSSSQIRMLDEKISAVEKMNAEMEGSLAVHSGDVSVCTEAVRLNLISSSGAQTISLTAPTGASLMLSSQESTAAEATEEPVMRASLTGE